MTQIKVAFRHIPCSREIERQVVAHVEKLSQVYHPIDTCQVVIEGRPDRTADVCVRLSHSDLVTRSNVTGKAQNPTQIIEAAFASVGRALAARMRPHRREARRERSPTPDPPSDSGRAMPL